MVERGLLCVTKDTPHPCYSRNSKSLRSSVPGIRAEAKYVFLIMSHPISIRCLLMKWWISHSLCSEREREGGGTQGTVVSSKVKEVITHQVMVALLELYSNIGGEPFTEDFLTRKDVVRLMFLEKPLRLQSEWWIEERWFLKIETPVRKNFRVDRWCCPD